VEVSLKEALKEVEGNKYFKVLEDGDLIKVSYRFNAPKVFDSPLKRELRGITFNRKSGKVVSRPFHKFFNLNEHPETDQNALMDREFVFRQKLDGTMVHPVLTEKGVRFLTQKDFDNPQIQRAQELLERDEKLKNLTEELLKKGLTPIFELISPSFQLVIPYDEEKLVLTEVRDNRSGKYLLEELQEELAQEGAQLPPKRVGTLKEVLKEIENLEFVEGFVGKNFEKEEPFPLFVKVKTPWYHKAHYAFTYLHNVPDHKLFNLFLNQKHDELFSQLTNEKLKEEKEKRLNAIVELYLDLVKEAERLKPFYGKLKFKEELEKSLSRLKRKHSNRFEKLELNPKDLAEGARIAKNRGKFEKFLGTKLYSALKHGEVKLKTP
jgi:RNA ligase